MKMGGRFWVFAYDDYYPNGAIDDLVGFADSLDDARALASNDRDRTDIYEVCGDPLAPRLVDQGYLHFAGGGPKMVWSGGKLDSYALHNALTDREREAFGCAPMTVLETMNWQLAVEQKPELQDRIDALIKSRAEQLETV